LLESRPWQPRVRLEQALVTARNHYNFSESANIF
jgi:hypothetical protein